ncbi:LSU ribosomal protein L20P [Peptoclostridium litorale DSM 5388]|uniref:Large ribosomal subunit protein bL20 n=1 Tax=Peptoclostridium litorale DSM 5388 TaxID=1121324 RepID=A0A069REQ8_PEPLI|nr:50S ribosomal protein L20 [Peptoclostridium litorale]KDR95534.1 50S ribosomal protein L20 [Peptoclostridium litorale DSM 5388]SIN97699.1 LSU ribosomal protein L20P [Peptoclostridium litorale DSM 5388]
MARVKKGVTARRRHKKVLKLAKGFKGARSKLFRPANQFVMKALRNAYVGRKLKKRDFRKLWITRINAGTRMHGLSYSKFISGLKLADININRKMLSEMAIHDPEGFKQLVDVAKQKLGA